MLLSVAFNCSRKMSILTAFWSDKATFFVCLFFGAISGNMSMYGNFLNLSELRKVLLYANDSEYIWLNLKWHLTMGVKQSSWDPYPVRYCSWVWARWIQSWYIVTCIWVKKRKKEKKKVVWETWFRLNDWRNSSIRHKREVRHFAQRSNYIIKNYKVKKKKINNNNWNIQGLIVHNTIIKIKKNCQKIDRVYLYFMLTAVLLWVISSISAYILKINNQIYAWKLYQMLLPFRVWFIHIFHNI